MIKGQMSGSREKRRPAEVAVLPYDLIFKILLLLPSEDLLRLSVVCKTWYRLIKSPNFVEDHLGRCETVLAFLRQYTGPPRNAFSIDTDNDRYTLFAPSSSLKDDFKMCLVEFKDKNSKISELNICGFDEILATCDGLVLAKNERKRLLVLNPTTRKLLPLKPGTLIEHSAESYGFVYSHRAREYKIVHMFLDKSGHIDSEILSLKTMLWKGINVPTFGLFRDFKHKPVAASGVLYWLPGNHDVSYLVSMDFNEEKFVRKTLPVNNTRVNDRLVENGGLLNFVAQMTVYRIQVWTLKTNECEDKWVKRHTINMDYDITGLEPVFMTKNGRYLIFRMFKNGFYEYDMEDEEMEKVVVDGNRTLSYKTVFPHGNTLASWDKSGPLW